MDDPSGTDDPTDVGALRILGAVQRALDAGEVTDKDGLHRLKHRLARQYGLERMPRDAELLGLMDDASRHRHRGILRKKPMRSGSGVAIVAVMSSPAACPHGKCVYCPGGPEVDAPQSYTGFEPSTMRAKSFAYDPYRIVRHRLGTLRGNGHSIDKVDVVVQGGTFPARDEAYQTWFIAGIYAACNAGPDVEGPPGFVPLEIWQSWSNETRAATLASTMTANEDAPCRVIGLTVETKPDWCFERHVDAMLAYGTTRVEVGVQTLDEDTTRLTNRGHTVADAARAIRIARDAGLKVCVHMMPGLPRHDPDAGDGFITDPAADRDDLRRMFEEPAWRPDMLKVYPTLVVMEGTTALKRWWQEGRYTPYDTEQALDIVADMWQWVPEWCRVQRVDRDIPTTHVEAGVMKSNLRQLAEEEAVRRGHPPRDIRAREVHHRAAAGRPADPDRLVLQRRDYEAGGGDEVFLAWEDPVADAIAGFLRLRRPGPRAHRAEAQGAAIVRELKVYGEALALGDHDDPERGAWQHQGLGARLLGEAERIAREEWNVDRVLVTAGVGVRAYYGRHGYEPLGPYMAKHA